MLHNQIAARNIEKKIASAAATQHQQAPVASSSAAATATTSSSTADAVRRVREAYAALPRSGSNPTSPIRPVPMNRSTSASNRPATHAAPHQQPVLHQRSVSAAEVPLYRSKTSAAISEALAASSSSSSNAAHGPAARPRVLHHISAAEVPVASTSTSTAGTRANAPGPFRPARTASSLGHTAEGAMSVTSMSTSTSRQGAGPIRIRPAMIGRTNSEKDVAPPPKRLLPGGPAVRRPPAPPKEEVEEDKSMEDGVANVDADAHKSPLASVKVPDTAAARSPTSRKQPEASLLELRPLPPKTVLPPGSRIIRQPFKPKSSSTKAHDQPERVRAPLTAPTASTKARAQTKVAAATASPERVRKQAPGSRVISPVKHTTAKLVVSPRKPRVKLKAPLPSFAPTRTRAPAAEMKASTTTSATVKVKAIGSLPKVDTLPVEQIVFAAAVPLPASPVAEKRALSDQDVVTVDQDERNSNVEPIAPIRTAPEQAMAAKSNVPPVEEVTGPTVVQVVATPAATKSNGSSRNTPSPTLCLPTLPSDISALAQQVPLPDSPLSASSSAIGDLNSVQSNQAFESPAPRAKTLTLNASEKKMDLLTLSDDEEEDVKPPRPPHSAPLTLPHQDLGIVSSPQRRLKVSKSLSSMRALQSSSAAATMPRIDKENMPSSPAPNVAVVTVTASASKVKRLSAFFEAKTSGTPERSMDAADKGRMLKDSPMMVASPVRRPKVLGNAGQL